MIGMSAVTPMWNDVRLPNEYDEPSLSLPEMFAMFTPARMPNVTPPSTFSVEKNDDELLLARCADAVRAQNTHAMINSFFLMFFNVLN
jgi:hypothetical protein